MDTDLTRNCGNTVHLLYLLLTTWIKHIVHVDVHTHFMMRKMCTIIVACIPISTLPNSLLSCTSISNLHSQTRTGQYSGHKQKHNKRELPGNDAFDIFIGASENASYSCIVVTPLIIFQFSYPTHFLTAMIMFYLITSVDVQHAGIYMYLWLSHKLQY